MKYIVTAALCALLMTAGAAHADNGKGKGHGQGQARAYIPQKEDNVIIIGSHDRAVIREYLSDDYRRNCPPGLAKKNNGCLPPGQAKKYRVGYPLPGGVVILPVPGDLLAQLSPAPTGYRYVRVDRDILLIGEATKKVIDAVTLISAMD